MNSLLLYLAWVLAPSVGFTLLLAMLRVKDLLLAGRRWRAQLRRDLAAFEAGVPMPTTRAGR